MPNSSPPPPPNSPPAPLLRFFLYYTGCYLNPYSNPYSSLSCLHQLHVLLVNVVLSVSCLPYGWVISHSPAWLTLYSLWPADLTCNSFSMFLHHTLESSACSNFGNVSWKVLKKCTHPMVWKNISQCGVAGDVEKVGTNQNVTTSSAGNPWDGPRRRNPSSRTRRNPKLYNQSTIGH